MLVVKTPRLPEEMRNYQGFYKAEVRVSSGRAGTCSSPLPFYYIPNGKNITDILFSIDIGILCSKKEIRIV